MTAQPQPPFPWLAVPSNRAPRASNRPPKAITCNGCDNFWTGRQAAHCAAKGCHRTFTGVWAFDKHRRSGKCVNPTEIGLVLIDRGSWQGWGSPGTWRGPQ